MINQIPLFKDKKLGRIYTFIDFGNVNYWYERDIRNAEGIILKKGFKLVVDIKKLASFTRNFAQHIRFYYGLDSHNLKSLKIITLARKYFDKAVTKQIQLIKHYLKPQERRLNTRDIKSDHTGQYIYIPKCNFDVEICLDAVRFIKNYDTFCLFSSDADFTYLLT